MRTACVTSPPATSTCTRCRVLAQEEIDPPYTGDLKLNDVEDGDEAELTISAPLLARYKSTLAAYRAELSGFCTRRGLAYSVHE